MSVNEIDEIISILDESIGNIIQKLTKLSNDLNDVYSVRNSYLTRRRNLINESIQENDQQD